ncbi:UNVERIFIED_CONTAM: hypothetical protein K2H54_052401 [Gekko kuhli]
MLAGEQVSKVGDGGSRAAPCVREAPSPRRDAPPQLAFLSPAPPGVTTKVAKGPRSLSLAWAFAVPTCSRERMELRKRALGDITGLLCGYNGSGDNHIRCCIVLLETALARGGFQNLSRLELTSNEIVYLPPGIFSGLHKLKHLDLRNNSLVDIKNSTFSGLNLRFLDLTLNAFRTLRREALSVFRRHLRIFLKDNPFVCNCDTEDLVSWLNQSWQVADADKLACVFPQELQNTSLVDQAGSELECHSSQAEENAFQTSYAALGVALGVIGVIFLFVLYLNRKGIKTWVNSMWDTCQNLLEEYRYRYEMDSDHRIAQVLALDI